MGPHYFISSPPIYRAPIHPLPINSHKIHRHPPNQTSLPKHSNYLISPHCNSSCTPKYSSSIPKSNTQRTLYTTQLDIIPCNSSRWWVIASSKTCSPSKGSDYRTQMPGACLLVGKLR